MTFYEQFAQETDAYVKLNVIDPMDDIKKKYSLCPVCKVEHNLFGYGAYSPLIAFIGLTVSPYEIAKNKIFFDKPNLKINGIVSYLSNYLKVRNNIYFTNLSLCDKYVPDRDRLIEELSVVNPKYIILLGHDIGKIFDCNFSEPNIIELDKFYKTFVTHSLKELFYDNDTYRGIVKQELDFIIKEILNG